MLETTSTRPYLIRAIYDWAVDNGLTPHLLVDTTVPEVHVPAGYDHDGKITLNVHPRAVNALDISAEGIRFSARFSGQIFQLSIPAHAVQAIFARENGQGFFFQQEPQAAQTATSTAAQASAKPKNLSRKGRPVLKLVK